MPTTTGTKVLTYPASGATSWYSTWETFAQAITDYLDDLDTTEIGTITDSNANEMCVFNTTASATNYFDFTNAATAGAVVLAAAGSDTNIDFNLNPKGSGRINLDGVKWPAADGTANYFLQTDGSASAQWAIPQVVDDTTPQLGGSLDVNGQEITGAIDLHSTGDIVCELGDDAGTNKISVKDSGAVEVASINSDGDIDGTDVTCDTITTTGAATLDSLTLTTATAATGIDVAGATDLGTVPSDDDMLLIYDDDAGANKKVAYSNFQQVIAVNVISPTVTISNDATVDLTSYITASYTRYRIEIENLVPATDNTSLLLRMSDDNGATFKSGGSDYTSEAIRYNGNSHSNAAGSITLAANIGNASDESANFIIDIFDPEDTSLDTIIHWQGAYVEQDSDMGGISGAGRYKTAAGIDAIQLLMSSGNISSGQIKVYGVS